MRWSQELLERMGKERPRPQIVLAFPKPVLNRCYHGMDVACDDCVDLREGPGSPGPTYRYES